MGCEVVINLNLLFVFFHFFAQALQAPPLNSVQPRDINIGLGSLVEFFANCLNKLNY